MPAAPSGSDLIGMGRVELRIISGRDGSRGWGTDKDKVGPGRVVALVADSGAKSLNFVVADETLSAHQEELTTRTELLSKLVRFQLRLRRLSLLG